VLLEIVIIFNEYVFWLWRRCDRISDAVATTVIGADGTFCQSWFGGEMARLWHVKGWLVVDTSRAALTRLVLAVDALSACVSLASSELVGWLFGWVWMLQIASWMAVKTLSTVAAKFGFEIKFMNFQKFGNFAISCLRALVTIIIDTKQDETTGLLKCFFQHVC
jgi:hypothetical protein